MPRCSKLPAWPGAVRSAAVPVWRSRPSTGGRPAAERVWSRLSVAGAIALGFSCRAATRVMHRDQSEVPATKDRAHGSGSGFGSGSSSGFRSPDATALEFFAPPAKQVCCA